MKHVVTHPPQPGLAEASAGIIAPTPVLLEMGRYIYRFASSRFMADITAPEVLAARPPDAPRAPVVKQSYRASQGLQAGRWWVREEDFDSIMERAARAGVDLGQKARWDLAVLQKWGSRMDLVVQARVRSRLWAWTGLAKPQRELTGNGQAIRLYGNREIRQLYLHDVTDSAGTLTPRGREALSVTGAKVIAPSLLRQG